MRSADPVRVVLDTNCVVSALVFQTVRLAWMRSAWQGGRFVPIGDRETVGELLRVTRYAKLKLSEIDREDLLSDYIPFLEIVPDGVAPTLPMTLRDPSDHKFVALAVRGKADALVSGDRDILDVRDHLPALRILSPVGFREWLDQEIRLGGE